MPIIGRKTEIKELTDYYNSGRPELVILYGRRRVGKTFLVREYFKNKFAFSFTGSINTSNKTNLSNFDRAIVKYGGNVSAASTNWSDAFHTLTDLLSQSPGERKIVFIDEMPWLDTARSGFLSAFDYFWNSFASSDPDILFIGCGSATSWITKKIFRNRGGLHNRVTGRIHLSPFTISECEEFFKSRGVVIDRYQLAECYMIFGGIPYYLDLFQKGLSLPQNVDRLCFSNNAPLQYEYDELFMSLYKNPDRHIAIVEALASKYSGLKRNEISELAKLSPNGRLTETLDELEQCGFIDVDNEASKNQRKNGCYYILNDPFVLFFIRYMKNRRSKDEHFWAGNVDEGGRNAWRGYAFEQLCRIHLRQVKKALGISGVSTVTASWRSKTSKPGAQIDLVIRRKDGVTNLCEMKYTKTPFEITESYANALRNKQIAFCAETGIQNGIHLTMITTFGITRDKGYISSIQSEVTLDDLFE